jgi:hypothetical protein
MWRYQRRDSFGQNEMLGLGRRWIRRTNEKLTAQQSLQGAVEMTQGVAMLHKAFDSHNLSLGRSRSIISYRKLRDRIRI